MSLAPNKILIVDDDASVRTALETMLSQVDCELSFAVNGLDCLAKAAEVLPDLVLLDVAMPVMDGMETCQRLRADPTLNAVPVIMVTALEDAASRLQGFEVGADDFINKPVGMLELQARVRSILRLNRYRRLADEQVRFKQLVEHISEGVALVDEDGRLIEWNPGQQRITGFGSAEVLGRRVWEIQHQLLPAEDRSPVVLERIAEAVRTMLRQGDPAHRPGGPYDSVIQRPDGQRCWVQISTFLIPTQAGWRVGFVTRDMTELKRIEATMRSQERLWERTMGSLRNAVFILSVETNRILDCNPAATQLFGYAREEMLGQTTDFLHVDAAALAEYRCHLYAAIERQGFLDELEFQMKRKNGTIFPSEHSVVPVEDEHGRLSRWVSVVCDNTRHQEALAIIQGLNQRLEHQIVQRSLEVSTLYKLSSLVNQSLSVLAILEQALALTVEIIGCAAAFICLQEEGADIAPPTGDARPRPRLHLAARQGLAETVAQRLNSAALDMALTGQVMRSGEAVSRRAVALDSQADMLTPWGDGDYLGLPMQVRGRVVGVLSLIDPAKEKLAQMSQEFLSIIADQISVVLENVRLRQEADAISQLKERERLARELHDSVIQELYSLSLIAAAARNLVCSGDESVAQHLDRITTTSKRIYRDMRLLIYALRPSILEEVGLVEALRLRLSMVEERVGLRAKLVIAGNARMPLSLEADLYYIAQETLNNALKHALATVVTVRLESTDERVQLAISDDGQGFDLAEAARQGGMGLASLQARAKKLGGELTLSSAAGQGTLVQVTIARR